MRIANSMFSLMKQARDACFIGPNFRRVCGVICDIEILIARAWGSERGHLLNQPVLTFAKLSHCWLLPAGRNSTPNRFHPQTKFHPQTCDLATSRLGLRVFGLFLYVFCGSPFSPLPYEHDRDIATIWKIDGICERTTPATWNDWNIKAVLQLGQKAELLGYVLHPQTTQHSVRQKRTLWTGHVNRQECK